MKFRDEKGMVTIEATIALTAFLFFFVMIYSIIGIVTAQAKIAVAVNNTAKEISHYSYLYALTGLQKDQWEETEDGEMGNDGVLELGQQLTEVFDGIQSLVQNDQKTLYDPGNQVFTTVGSSDDFINNLQDLSEDPLRLMVALGNIGLSGIDDDVIDDVLNQVGENLAKVLVERNLVNSQHPTSESFLRSLNVVPGGPETLNGLDFSNTKLFPGKTDDIEIIVAYKVRIMPLLPINLEYPVIQRAKTRGWMNGDINKRP